MKKLNYGEGQEKELVTRRSLIYIPTLYHHNEMNIVGIS